MRGDRPDVLERTPGWRRVGGAGVLLALTLTLNAPAGVVPGRTWETRKPAEVGLDIRKLDEVGEFLGGQGCVVRHGYLAYTWGDPARRQDVASACKPVIAHFLFKAGEDGRLAGLDERVAKWAPCLETINAGLDHKDRAITFRHMATQTSCYGVSERPGTAFDYNDWQMALLWDTLFLRVYGAEQDQVDRAVLRPLLTDVLQCEDEPTFLAFGEGRAGRLRISARDFARFGLLYLNQGRWGERQLISARHARLATQSPLPAAIPQTGGRPAEMCPGQRTLGSQRVPDNQTDHFGSYSYLWWVNGVERDGRRHWPDAPPDTFGAFGHENGQRAVAVIPSLDLVISWNDTTLGEKSGNPQNEVFRRLAESVIDGSLTTDPEHPAWLRLRDGRPFFLCGPGDPEDFLYRGRRRPDGTRDGDQPALIEKLAGTGANALYMIAVRSHGGDGDATHNPFINGDPARGVNVKILDQWDAWLTAMDRHGIAAFLILYDDSASPFGKGLPPEGALKPEEAAFLETLVDRLKHHRYLIWCVAEEYAEGLSREHAIRVAEHLRRRDDRRHPISIHQNNATAFDFNDAACFDQFAVQWNVDTPAELHAGAVAAWKDTGGRRNLNLAEFADARLRGSPSSGTGRDLRRKLWAIATGGAGGMVLGMDIASTPRGDLEDCGRLVRFMQSTPLQRLSPHDERAGEPGTWVLAGPGGACIAYREDAAELAVRVEAGVYRLRWFDPASGREAVEAPRVLPAGTQRFSKPESFGPDAALYLEPAEPETGRTP